MNFSGSYVGLISIASTPKSPIRFQTPKQAFKRVDSNKLHFTSKNIYGNISMSSAHCKCSASSLGGRNQHNLRFDDSHFEPFWVTLSKQLMWSLRSLGVFLLEQPGQLKHIEWPGFQSTLKTATLALVLVVILIVALSSVDSALCYLLALLLRKPA